MPLASVLARETLARILLINHSKLVRLPAALWTRPTRAGGACGADIKDFREKDMACLECDAWGIAER